MAGFDVVVAALPKQAIQRGFARPSRHRSHWLT